MESNKDRFFFSDWERRHIERGEVEGLARTRSGILKPRSGQRAAGDALEPAERRAVLGYLKTL